MPSRILWKTFYYCQKVLPHRTIVAIILILVTFNLSLFIIQPRPKIIEIEKIETVSPLTPKHKSTPKSTKQTSKSTPELDNHFHDYWHSYNISGNILHVYSAYFDDREKFPVLRLNAATKGRATVRNSKIFFCYASKLFSRVSLRRQIASLKRSTKVTLSRLNLKWSLSKNTLVSLGFQSLFFALCPIQ